MAKLTKKLLLSYFIIVLMMGGLGLGAYTALSSVNKNGETMYKNGVVPLSLLADIAKYSENTRVQMVTAVNTKNASPTKIAEENIIHIKDVIEKYEKISMIPEEKEKFEEFTSNWYTFTDRVAKNIILVKNEQYEEATAGLKLGGEPFTLASDSLKELININNQMAEELMNQNEQNYKQTRLLLILTIAVATIVAISVGLFVGRNISQPVMKISARANEIAKGDLTGETILIKNKDEIGDLAQSFNEMKEGLRALVSSVSKSAEELAAVSEEMAASSEQVSSSVQEVSISMNHVAQNTELGNNSVVDVSTVLLELSSLIQIAKNKATSALNNSETTYKTATDGKDIVNKSIDKIESIRNRTIETEVLIQKLDQYTQEIGHITQMITSIADQTNLLALNASIEAARAGEHGRGFAVVAEEVRKLAEQSNSGANQVAELVKKISGSTGEVVRAMHLNKSEVEQGVEIVSTAGDALDRILDAVSLTLKEVDGISDVTDEEVASSDKIVKLISDLSSVMENTAANTEEVAASIQESTAAMETVSGSAEEVSSMAAELKSSVEVFRI
ncbi:methyl-accepting chemotaxis protein [Cytobacillus sp. FJAT-54145]|uniref:Methyl-accepting chemotaxis protein n=1 Tax=Cytobacillus spartinae TaxID=3299023 RepID=A0ABW6K4Q7_9BACI